VKSTTIQNKLSDLGRQEEALKQEIETVGVVAERLAPDFAELS
jgi:hypothetical protein